ncbi:reverse transcriptase domain-containing protein (plasmid) [Enterobacter sp. JS8-1]|uniref:reverse transcriptase domain-containing protein n=1 Tax=Enterobacter sp. JS8-1 TaxID=3411633 RepID=UPI003B9DE87D
MMWSAADALVLKWAALTVAPQLSVHPRCLHLQGGAHRAVSQVAEQLSTGRWQYVYRTDIRGYYRHIRKDMAWQVWQENTRDPACLNLIHQYLHYSTEQAGVIHTPATGIPRGCALSPQTGAILLRHMDRHFSDRQALFYVRYMDDFLILTEKRWPLRRAIANLNGYLDLDGFERHPDKTQTGRLGRGFDWCGVQFTAGQSPRISDRSLTKHRERCRRLVEQLRARGMAEDVITARVSAYRNRWNIWAAGILRAAGQDKL